MSDDDIRHFGWTDDHTPLLREMRALGMGFREIADHISGGVQPSDVQTRCLLLFPNDGGEQRAGAPAPAIFMFELAATTPGALTSAAATLTNHGRLVVQEIEGRLFQVDGRPARAAALIEMAASFEKLK